MCYVYDLEIPIESVAKCDYDENLNEAWTSCPVPEDLQEPQRNCTRIARC